jgi:hypothetical protein
MTPVAYSQHIAYPLRAVEATSVESASTSLQLRAQSLADRRRRAAI